MRILHVLGTAALVMGGAWAGAQEPAKSPAGKVQATAAPSAEEKAMMDAWMAVASPGAAHKVLAELEGSWTATTKIWQAPGAPPQESTATSDAHMVLGGRFLEERVQGQMMGMPFEGMGLTGYDNYKKKYLATWADNLGTTIMTMEGTADVAGKVITSTGTVDDFVKKKPTTVKSVMTIVDPDHHVYEMWQPGPDGKPYKNLEITYTRKQ